MREFWLNKFLKTVLGGVFLAVLFFSSGIVLADDYDIYVDADYDGEREEGTEEEPFNSLEDALKEAEAEDLKDIYIKEGTYEGDLVVEQSVNFIGEDKNKVVIEGNIEANDNFKAEKLTIKGSVVIVGDSDLELKNCKVKDFSGIGIEALKGDGKVEVEDCEVSGEGKGFYIMRGREIRIENNDIHHNIGEEAVDLRAELSGSVKDNKIHNNGESGIEVIVGGADLEITGNDIEDSGSSAIATQFYPDWEDKGKIVIKDNTLEDSDNYGIDCKRPQGGSGGGNYFRDSLEVSDNEIQDNDKGDIADYCGLGKDDEKEVQKETSAENKVKTNEVVPNKNEKKESLDENSENTEENNKDKKQEEEARKKALQENKKVVSKELQELTRNRNEVRESLNQKKQVIEKRSSIAVFFFGPSFDEIKESKTDLEEIRKELNKLKELEKKAMDSQDKKEIETQATETQNFIEESGDFIKRQEERFSLFGWLVKWFR